MFRKLFERHPKEYHYAAVILATLGLGITLTTSIFAEEGLMVTGGNQTAAVEVQAEDPEEPPKCSYSCGQWSACQPDGKRYCKDIKKSPDGCKEGSIPDFIDSCDYEAPSCNYSYSGWSDCKPEGKKFRTVTAVSPPGCKDDPKPLTLESCTYTAPISQTTTAPISQTTTSTSTSTSNQTAPPQCIYQYGPWSSCQPEGKRYQKLLSKSPSGCQEYAKPVTEQSCIYDGTNTVTTQPTGTTIVPMTAQQSSTTTGTVGVIGISPATDASTPPFAFLNVTDGMTIRGEFEIRGMVANAMTVEFYLVSVGSNTYKYLGKAEPESDNRWRLKFKSETFPNDNFYLRAKIENAYGKYGSGQRKISIFNGDRSLVSAPTAENGFETLGMSEDEKRTILKQFVQDIQAPDTIVLGTAATVEDERREVLNFCLNNVERCRTEKDTDRDGLSDVDEIRYGSNPQAADSDLDGFIDGDEVRNGFDPVKYSAGDKSDKIIFESPKTAGEVRKDLYEVHTVEFAEYEGGGKRLKLSGKGLPNSFVTVYVYSDPIILTVKTDSEGNWTYELDKDVEDGEHEVFVAITDNTGKITAKSEPLPFVKTAQAASVVSRAEASPVTQVETVSQSRSSNDLLYFIAVSLSTLAAALAIIGLVRHRMHLKALEAQSQTPMNPSL